MPEDYRQLVIDKANQYGINPNIALAQIQRESGFNPRAVGSSGERGLSQFTAGTWARFGQGSFDNAFDPVLNLDAWGKYMIALIAMFNGDYFKALIGYNGGEGHLTNPERYGPPSAAARAYAQAIYAQAGFTAESVADLDQWIVGPTPDWLKWALIGLVGLVIWTAVSD